MQIIKELRNPNILLLPIGDRFTMGPEGAALAVDRFFKEAKWIVPMHYGTFPLLTGTFEQFKVELQKKNDDLTRLIHSPDIKDDGKEWNVDLDSLKD